jgi:hypothetical protein
MSDQIGILEANCACPSCGRDVQLQIQDPDLHERRVSCRLCGKPFRIKLKLSTLLSWDFAQKDLREKEQEKRSEQRRREILQHGQIFYPNG